MALCRIEEQTGSTVFPESVSRISKKLGAGSSKNIQNTPLRNVLERHRRQLTEFDFRTSCLGSLCKCLGDMGVGSQSWVPHGGPSGFAEIFVTFVSVLCGRHRCFGRAPQGPNRVRTCTRPHWPLVGGPESPQKMFQMSLQTFMKTHPDTTKSCFAARGEKRVLISAPILSETQPGSQKLFCGIQLDNAHTLE